MLRGMQGHNYVRRGMRGRVRSCRRSMLRVCYRGMGGGVFRLRGMPGGDYIRRGMRRRV